MAKIMELEEVRRRLRDRKIYVVSEATGLHFHTLRRLRDGDTKKPSYDTVRRVSEYFHKVDQFAKRKNAG